MKMNKMIATTMFLVTAMTAAAQAQPKCSHQAKNSIFARTAVPMTSKASTAGSSSGSSSVGDSQARKGIR